MHTQKGDLHTQKDMKGFRELGYHSSSQKLLWIETTILHHHLPDT